MDQTPPEKPSPDARPPAREGRPKRPPRLPLPSVLEGLDDVFARAYPALRRPRSGR